MKSDLRYTLGLWAPSPAFGAANSAYRSPTEAARMALVYERAQAIQALRAERCRCTLSPMPSGGNVATVTVKLGMAGTLAAHLYGMGHVRRFRLWPLRVWISRPFVLDAARSSHQKLVHVRGWALERSWRGGSSGRAEATRLRSALRMLPRLGCVRSAEQRRLRRFHLAFAGLLGVIAVAEAAVGWPVASAFAIVVGGWHLHEAQTL